MIEMPGCIKQGCIQDVRRRTDRLTDKVTQRVDSTQQRISIIYGLCLEIKPAAFSDIWAYTAAYMLHIHLISITVELLNLPQGRWSADK